MCLHTLQLVQLLQMGIFVLSSISLETLVGRMELCMCYNKGIYSGTNKLHQVELIMIISFFAFCQPNCISVVDINYPILPTKLHLKC